MWERWSFPLGSDTDGTMSVPEITTICLSPSRKGFGTLQTVTDTHIATHMARDAVDIGKYWAGWAHGEKVLSASAIVELITTLKDSRESFCSRTESHRPGSTETETGNLKCLKMLQELGYSSAVYWEALSSVPSIHTSKTATTSRIPKDKCFGACWCSVMLELKLCWTSENGKELGPLSITEAFSP